MEGHSDILVILDNSYSMEYYLKVLALTRQVFDQPPTVTIPPIIVWKDLVETSRDNEISERFEICDDTTHKEQLYLALLLFLVAIFCLIVICH